MWEDNMKLTLTMDLFITNMQIFTSQDINWWTVDYCEVWTLILTAPIHCRGAIDEQVM